MSSADYKFMHVHVQKHASSCKGGKQISTVYYIAFNQIKLNGNSEGEKEGEKTNADYKELVQPEDNSEGIDILLQQNLLFGYTCYLYIRFPYFSVLLNMSMAAHLWFYNGIQNDLLKSH